LHPLESAAFARRTPSAVAHGRQLLCRLNAIAAVSATLIVERVGHMKSVEHLALGPWARKWANGSLLSLLQ